MNEISIRAALSCEKGGSKAAGDTTKLQTLAGLGAYENCQVIGLAPELIEYPSDLLVEGVSHVWFRNAGTNPVELYMNAAGTSPFSRLLTNDVTLVRSATATPGHYACAFTAPAPTALKVVAVGT